MSPEQSSQPAPMFCDSRAWQPRAYILHDCISGFCQLMASYLTIIPPLPQISIQVPFSCIYFKGRSKKTEGQVKGACFLEGARTTSIFKPLINCLGASCCSSFCFVRRVLPCRASAREAAHPGLVCHSHGLGDCDTIFC